MHCTTFCHGKTMKNNFFGEWRNDNSGVVCEQKLGKTDQKDRNRNEDCNEFTFHRTFIKIIQPTAAV